MPILTVDESLGARLRPFAREHRPRSALETAATAILLVAFVAGAACSSLPWPVRIVASIGEGFSIVRGFVLFHDVMHGAIFRGSRLARLAFSAFGALLLVPTRVWRDTHDYHHAHTAKIVGSNIGSFPLVTLAMWRRMSRTERTAYRFARHPLTMLFAYFTVFALGMCALPLARNPRKNAGAAAVLLLHGAVWTVPIVTHAWSLFVLVYLLPLSLACAVGAYLFYAQHNFPGMRVSPRERWTASGAALEATSYFEMNVLLRFFTGNIGFHHVHHLHAGIPFYCLPSVAQALPELAAAARTSFRPRDVRACLRLKIWDVEQGCMVPFPRAALPAKA